MRVCKIFNAKSLKFLFHMISVNFPPVLVNKDDGSNAVQIFTYLRFFSTFAFEYNWRKPNNGFSAHCFTHEQTTKITSLVGGNVFACTNLVYLSSDHSEGHSQACFPSEASSSIRKCVPEQNSKPFELFCDSDMSINNFCSFLFYKSGNKICSPFHVYYKPVDRNKTEVTLSLTGQRAGCPFGQPFSCGEYITGCYQLSDICIYKLSTHFQLKPCKNGGHIESCAYFECDMTLKCPVSYCVPWSYVCDGKWDCPFGSDESREFRCFLNTNCSEMFRCKQSQICIHLGTVCDGKSDCWLADDEAMCELHNVSCPNKCTCFGFALKCHSVHVYSSELTFTFPYQVVSILNSSISELVVVKNHFVKVLVIALIKSNIQEICALFNERHNLRFLDCSFNDLSMLRTECFLSIRNLKIIKLNNNVLNTVFSSAFSDLPNLLFINLRNNLLENFQQNIFRRVLNLKVIFVSNNTLADMHHLSFTDANLSLFETSNFRTCCILSSDTVCLVYKAWFETCGQLLPSSFFRAVFLMMSFLVFCFNAVSCLLHQSRGTAKTGFNITVTGYCTCNFLITIYLSLIFGVGFFFGTNYTIYEEKWRSSLLCFFSNALVLDNLILSTALLVFLSTSRLLVVSYPLKSQLKSKNLTLKSVVYLSFISFLLSSLETTVVTQTAQQMPSGLCLSLVDPTNRPTIFKVTTILLSSYQILACPAIAALYVSLFKRLKNERQKFQEIRNMEKVSISLIIQITLSSVANFLSWLPSCSIFLAFITMEMFPMNVVIFNVGLLMPLSSTLHPILFIVMKIRAKGRKDKN